MPGALFQAPLSADEISSLLHEYKKQNVLTYGPRMFRPSYFAGQDVVDVAEAAFMLFIKENWLYGRTSYPAVGVFEDEILASLLDLYHAPRNAGGALTSGGTESDMIAVKSARDRALRRGRKLTKPNIVLLHTAHPALNKGAIWLGLEVRREPGRGAYLPDVQWAADACDEQTVMLVASAPPYPFGQVDPIAQLAEIARRREIWLHVDSALGGMILPFREAAGLAPVQFDFRIPGVDSISADLHKCGYASKGISSIVYADREDELAARTMIDDWPSGVYATSGVAGTRSAGALAAAWAVMRYLGESGYKERTRKIFSYRNKMIDALKGVGATIIGDPHCYHFNFIVEGVSMPILVEELIREKWVVASSQNPDTVQLMITAAHEHSSEPFAADVARLCSEIKAGKRKGTGQGAVYSKLLSDNKAAQLRRVFS
jgi:sphinganine-1-phosphate aldolase